MMFPPDQVALHVRRRVDNSYVPARRRKDNYVIETKQISSTFLRTVTTTVSTTLVTPFEQVTSTSHGPAFTTILSTTQLCLPLNARAGEERDLSSSVEFTGHTRTPPLPPFRLDSSEDSSSEDLSLVTGSESFRTWIGTLQSNVEQGSIGSGVDSHSANGNDFKVPQKFILLQHLWPETFILESGEPGSKKHRVKLSPIDSIERSLAINRRLRLRNLSDERSNESSLT